VESLIDVPVWGQWTILGLSLAWNVYVAVRIIIGALVPYNRVEAEQKNTATWVHAWEVSEQTKHEATELARQLLVTTGTMEKVLKALPPVQVANVIVTHDNEDGSA
jgi:hypothetical protein